MPPQRSQTSSASTVDDRREGAPWACAPETRRLLRWGSLGVSLLLVVSAFTWWWATRFISLPVKPHTSTPRVELPADHGFHLHRMNVQDPPALLPKRRNTKRPKTDPGCPRDDDYGSVCDYERCSAREEAAKSILLWNARWTFAPEWTSQGGVSGLVGCEPRDCFVSVAPSAVPAAAYDAIVFDMGDGNSPHAMEGPINRSCFQRYVFLLMQYPRSVAFWEDWRFNWTMTYRLDSDVPLPVGRVAAKAGAQVPERGWMQLTSEQADNNEIGDVISDKAVITFLTTCRNQQVEAQFRAFNYLKLMSDILKIRIFRLKVNFWSKEMWQNFYDYLYHTQHKFYLVFEFPHCKVLQVNTIPVVFGGANYSALLPPYSYIDGTKFKSPVQLATYLLYLLRHPQEYAKYFWWKPYYDVQINTSRTLCQLCARLHADQQPKSYENVLKWMNRDVFFEAS